jgi:hypothetical protein
MGTSGEQLADCLGFFVQKCLMKFSAQDGQYNSCTSLICHGMSPVDSNL